MSIAGNDDELNALVERLVELESELPEEKQKYVERARYTVD